MDLSNYHNKTLPNFAQTGYGEWIKQQNAKKNTGASGSLNSGVFTDATSNAIREAAEKAASQSVSQSVANQNYLFHDDIVPQGMSEGFKEYQIEQAINGGQTGNTGSTVPTGSPIVSQRVDTKNNTDAKKDAVSDGGDAGYVADAGVIQNPTDYGFSMDDYEGFSYGDFQVSDAYLKAMDYTNSLLSQLTSGRTSYTDQINALMGEYQNRDKFSYDASTDAMFQQMLASSMNSGKMAMQDTIGQAAALTGGYGNTYGTAAGNAAYNQYISDAYSNLPEYYNLALDAYNMEGDQMLSELAMLRDADSAEYSRLVDSYRASLDAANTMYDREYTQYIDDRNAAESEYWDDLNFRYGAYLDALDQSNKDRDFNYGAEQDRLDREERSDEREYQRGLDKAEWDYRVATDALSALGGSDSQEYDALSNTDLQKIKDTFIANGGASGNGYEAVDQMLSLIGKNNVDNDALFGMLGGMRSPVEDYADAINGMDHISQERKEELIREIYERYAMMNNK